MAIEGMTIQFEWSTPEIKLSVSGNGIHITQENDIVFVANDDVDELVEHLKFMRKEGEKNA